MVLLMFALQTFNKALILLDYAANTKAYAENCENKVRPAMHCKGKCQVMKKLQQEEKKDEQHPDRKAENKKEILLSSKSFFPAITIAASEKQHSFPLFHTGQEMKRPRSLWRPPIG